MKDLFEIVNDDRETMYQPEIDGIEGIDTDLDDKEFGIIGADEGDFETFEELQEMYG